MADDGVVICAYGCGKPFLPVKKGAATARGHVECYHAMRRKRSADAGAERRALSSPPREEEETSIRCEPLAEDVRKRLLKGETSILDLADEFDVSPKRINEALGQLRANGYNLAVHDADGAAPRLMIARDAVGERPALSINAESFYEGHRIEFGFVSDTHLGSKWYREEVLQAIYDNFARNGIRHVFHGGNYVEGEKDHNRFHLVCRPGMQAQIDYFVDKYPQREGITTYFVAGDDHEGWWQQREGIDIGRFTQSEAEKQGRHDLVNLGYMEAEVLFRAKSGDCKLRVMHAGGGSAYAISYSAQKIIESLEGGEKPQILGIGHFHKSEYLPNYRNVHCFQLGTTKAQDTFMRKKRLMAMVGAWRCSFLLDSDGVVTEGGGFYLPFFNRGYYESLAIDASDNRVSFVGPNETFNIVTDR